MGDWTTTSTVKWFLDVETAAALEREGSWDQSAQSTTARPKSGQLQQVGKTDLAGI